MPSVEAVAGNGAGDLRELKLIVPEIRYLAFMLEHGGEIPWDWSKVPTVNGKALIVNLINKGLLIEREHVTHAAQLNGALHLALTERGQAVARELAKHTIAASPRGQT